MKTTISISKRELRNLLEDHVKYGDDCDHVPRAFDCVYCLTKDMIEADEIEVTENSEV